MSARMPNSSLTIAATKTGGSQIFKASLDDRAGQRRPVKRKVEIAVRVGRLGIGADIGSELIDVSEEGLGMRLKASVPVGRELCIELLLTGTRKPLRLVAQVRWCEPAGDGTFLTGVLLQWRLPYLTVLNLTQ
jgi:hypothetical protein